MNNPEKENKFNQRLKSLREYFNLTQKQLGSIVGYIQSAIARLERAQRQPDIDILIKFARYFDVSIDYLVGIID